MAVAITAVSRQFLGCLLALLTHPSVANDGPLTLVELEDVTAVSSMG